MNANNESGQSLVETIITAAILATGLLITLKSFVQLLEKLTSIAMTIVGLPLP